MTQRLKIASWNINSVRARIGLVDRLIAEQQPDILCLQETKVLDTIFPSELFQRHGYVHAELNGQRMHHGVAILSRLPLNDPGKHDWQDNGEARHVGVRLPCGIRLENVYVPAGGDTPDRTFIPAPERCFTWWSYRSPDWTKNDRGRRLDHMWASPELAGHIKAHAVLEPCRNWERPSDHVPLICEIEV